MDIINRNVFLTAKPIVYLINMSKQEFLAGTKLPNEEKLMALISHDGKHPARVVKYSVEYEQDDSEDRSKSQIKAII